MEVVEKKREVFLRKVVTGEFGRVGRVGKEVFR
jgi:hypothetical protein